jgi:hypothetical protein
MNIVQEALHALTLRYRHQTGGVSDRGELVLRAVTQGEDRAAATRIMINGGCPPEEIHKVLKLIDPAYAEEHSRPSVADLLAARAAVTKY